MNSTFKSFDFDIASLRNGEKGTFEALYKEFFGMIYHICLNYLNDSHAAEEIVQETFMKLWEIRASLDESMNLRNYLYTIAKNNCLNYIRNQKVAIIHKESIRYLEMQFNYEALEKLGNYIQFEELQHKIDEAISRLPEDIRETFCMNRFEELHYKEIALKQNISVKTVEARISKALKMLRHELKDYLYIIYLVTNLLN